MWFYVIYEGVVYQFICFENNFYKWSKQIQNLLKLVFEWKEKKKKTEKEKKKKGKGRKRFELRNGDVEI